MEGKGKVRNRPVYKPKKAIKHANVKTVNGRERR